MATTTIILIYNASSAKWLAFIDCLLPAKAKMWNVNECLMSGSWWRRLLDFAEGRLLDLLH